MDSAARPPEPWVAHRRAANAHVLVGDETYTELSLRCATLDEPANDGSQLHRPGEDDLVAIARYATTLARALAAAGTPPTAISVDADVRRERAASELTLRIFDLAIRADVPGLDDGTRLATAATATASEWAAQRSAGPQVRVRVASTLLRPAAPAEDAPQTAPRGIRGPSARSFGARRWRQLAPRLSARRPSLPRLPKVAVPRLRVPKPALRYPRWRRPVLPGLAPRRIAVPRPAVPRPALPGLAALRGTLAWPRLPARLRLAAALAAGAVLLVLAAFVGVSAGNEQTMALLGLGAERDADSSSAALAALATPAAATAAVEAPPVATGAPPVATEAPPQATDAPAPTTVPLGVLATPLPAPTSAAAVAPPATSTPAAPRLVLEEPFAGRSRLPWPNDPQANAWLAADGYHLLARQPGQFVAVGPPGGERLRDVIVTATFQKIGGPLGGGYGIILRDQGPGPRDGVSQGGRYYVLEVGDRGQVGMWRREEDHWVDLVAWTTAPAAHAGDAENQLTARAIGQQLTLLVNGTQVATWEDATLADGTVAVFLGGDRNEAVLKRFVVQTPS